MLYNASVKDYGVECQLTLYSRGVWSDGYMCDDYGVKIDRIEHWDDDEINPFDGEKVHDLDEIRRKVERSLSSSLSRTKHKIYDLVRGKAWELFVTFTFSPDVVNRYDFEECSAQVKAWLAMQRRRHERVGFDLFYMVVPELHQDGAYHFHGILGNVSPELLGLESSVGDEYHVTSYTAGFSTATYVKDQGAVSSYITKYITKDLCAVSKGKKRYWASRNLSSPSVVRVALKKPKQAGTRLDSILESLAPYVAYVSSSDGPYGACTYVELRASLDDVLSRLLPYVGSMELSVDCQALRPTGRPPQSRP